MTRKKSVPAESRENKATFAPAARVRPRAARPCPDHGANPEHADAARRGPGLAEVRFSSFPRVAPVRQAQIVQKTLDSLEVRLVAVRPLAADEERRLEELICETVGVRFDVVFSYFDEIPRNPNGKYEDFRREVTAE